MREFIEQILEEEKNGLLDYLHGYCDNPLAMADEKLCKLFAEFGVDDVHIIRNVLDYAVIDCYFNGSLPEQVDYSVWINISETEVPIDNVPDDYLDEFMIIGESGIYYVGYGMIVEYEKARLIEYLQSWDYRRSYRA